MSNQKWRATTKTNIKYSVATFIKWIFTLLLRREMIQLLGALNLKKTLAGWLFHKVEWVATLDVSHTQWNSTAMNPPCYFLCIHDEDKNEPRLYPPKMLVSVKITYLLCYEFQYAFSLSIFNAYKIVRYTWFWTELILSNRPKWGAAIIYF